MLRTWRQALGVAGVVGAAVSKGTFVLYLLSPLGPTNDLNMADGVIGVYRLGAAGQSQYAAHHAMLPPDANK